MFYATASHLQLNSANNESSFVLDTFIDKLMLLSLNKLMQMADAQLSFFMFTVSFNLVSAIRDFSSSTNYINVVHVIRTREKILKHDLQSIFLVSANTILHLMFA